jgi:hypothetical protein
MVPLVVLVLFQVFRAVLQPQTQGPEAVAVVAVETTETMPATAAMVVLVS